MEMPDDAQRSEDGQYWWDGAEWQPVENTGAATTADGQLSEDGQYWWDGTEWQPVVNEDEPMDWDQYPELARALHYSEDLDAYLQDLGLDPSTLFDDEPVA